MSHTYKKNYLKQVIFRIDFEKVELSDFETFKTQVNERFDEGSKKQGKFGNFQLKVDSGEVINSTEDVEIWHFLDTKTGNKFEASPTHCLIEYFAYKNSEDLIENIKTLCNKFLEIHGVKQASRIGLRYINEIEIDSVKKLEDWSTYILEELLTASHTLKSKGKTPTRILNQAEFKAGSYSTVFKYGIWNDKYPSPITGSSYILDIDCFTRLPVDLDEGELVSVTSSLNKEAEEVFELSITDKLRKEMEK